MKNFSFLLLASACSAGATGGGGGGDDVVEIDAATPVLRVCATGGATFTTLTDAVAGAPAGATLMVCPGTYAEHLVIDGQTIALRGERADTTIIDAGGSGTAITISGGAAVALSGLTVRGGNTGAPGGGIACRDSILDLEDGALIGNRSTSGGGGLYSAVCDVRLTRTRVEGNEGGPLGGGVVLAISTGAIVDGQWTGNSAEEGGGLAISEGTVEVRGNHFEDNSARVRGGAMHVSSDATVTGNTVVANHAGWTGAGLYVDRHAPTISGNTFDRNDAVEEGGGVYVHQSQATIADNVMTGNSAGDDGGGLRLFESAAHVERNRISGNTCGDAGAGVKVSHVASELVDNEIRDNVAGAVGGGIELDNDSSVVRGGVIAGNRAHYSGGGIHISRWPWHGGTIDGVHVTGNHADSGGGLMLDNNFQPVALIRITVDGNTAAHGAGLYARASTFTLINAALTANVATGEGGAVSLAAPEPWLDPCPCPPTAPAMSIAFAVMQGNQAATGAALATAVPNLTVTSSIVADHAGVAVSAADGAAPTWRYNDTVPASFAGMLDPTGTSGNLAAPPQFADAAFRLTAASQCVDAGDPALRDRDGSRADMGLFAGPESP